jgi:hypothetical protein
MNVWERVAVMMCAYAEWRGWSKEQHAVHRSRFDAVVIRGRRVTYFLERHGMLQ